MSFNISFKIILVISNSLVQIIFA